MSKSFLANNIMSETSKKLAQSLLSSVEQFLEDTKRHYNKKDDSTNSNSNSNEFSASRDGFDFFEVKNTVLCSYLIDITHLISLKLGSGDTTTTKNAEEDSITRKRLHETRVILEKIRPMDKKMAYQTKKLLSFADDSSVVLQQTQDNGELRNVSQPENPLSFGPKPDALLARDDDDEVSKEDETNEYPSEDDQDDDFKAAAIASTTSTKAQTTTNTNTKDNGIYKAPRITSVEYLETRDRIQQEKQRVDEKRRQRMKNSELLQTLSETYGDTPEEDDVDGGAAWKTSTRARVLSEKEAERTAYEEEAMVRFTMSRKEKKERNRILQEEKSNLRSLSDFGNLTAGISAFVESNNGDHPDEDDDGDKVRNYDSSSRHANGRRKRRDDDDGDYGRKNKMRGRTSKKRNEESNLFFGGKKKRNKR